MVTIFIMNLSRKAALLLALSVFIAITPISANSASTEKIMVVKSADLKPYQDVLRGLRDECGCDVQEMKLTREDERDKILESNPSAIVAIGTAAFKMVRTITDLPVIYTMVIPSETAPPLSPNISGVSIDISPETYLSTMMALFPKAKRIGLLYDPRNTGAFVEEAVKAAHAAKIDLVTDQVRDPSRIPEVLNTLQQKIDILWMLPDPTVVGTDIVEYMFQFSFQNKIPIVSFSKKYVEIGAVASLDIDPYDMGEQVSSIVNSVLSGQSVRSTVYARKSHLTINKKVASKLGLKIDDDLLVEVNKID
ncbi:MAG TPA: ABC transporter substrate binding protein [Nitrospirota bacterium]|nr:ABC transporter substrate binding protein [Nitrospirota bacterium]